jgi:hypothetical protein
LLLVPQNFSFLVLALGTPYIILNLVTWLCGSSDDNHACVTVEEEEDEAAQEKAPKDEAEIQVVIRPWSCVHLEEAVFLINILVILLAKRGGEKDCYNGVLGIYHHQSTLIRL